MSGRDSPAGRGAGAVRARWVAAEAPGAATELVAAGHPKWLARLLARRGVADPQSAEAFLSPGEQTLSDPRELPGVQEGVELLRRAAAEGRRVAVVGDYDVDGVAATALLVAVFRACGLSVEPILPERLSEGYGFLPLQVEKAVAAGCGLIVTADCGSGAHEGQQRALASGVGVIVTDHHRGGREETALEGVVEINPQRHPGGLPWSQLSGAGVALKLALGLAEASSRPVEEEALLRVAALGTVADMVPLTAENRVIAARGMAALSSTRSPGLRALMRRAGVRHPVEAADIGYRLGPRINAVGRMGSAAPALELLLTRDPGRAEVLAEVLESANRERQAVETAVLEDARSRVEGYGSLPPIVVDWSPGWHRGVLGIVAGRLARDLHRPVILLTDEGELATGSGRSVPGIDLHAFLGTWSRRMRRFGGHRQAVGLTVEAGNLEALREEWQAAADFWKGELLTPRLEYELELTADEVDGELIAGLERLAPFGVANPRPLLRVGPLRLQGAPRTFGNGHLGARTVSPGGREVELVAWGWGERGGELEGNFEVLAHLVRDRFLDAPALRLKDLRRLA